MRNCPHGISAPAAAGAKSACETVCLCVPAVVRELPPASFCFCGPVIHVSISFRSRRLPRRSSKRPSRCIVPSRRERALRFMPRYRAICSRVIPAQTISPVFPASCRRYASSLVRPSGMDRRRIWRCNAQYFSEISSSRLDSSRVQSLPPSSAQQRSSASSDRNRILDGLAVRSSTGLPTVRADIKTSPNSPPASCTAERLSCPSCVYRHASTRPDSTIPAWSIRSPIPQITLFFPKQAVREESFCSSPSRRSAGSSAKRI